MSYHPILEKQLKKHLPPAIQSGQVAALCEAVSQYYDLLERDKQLSEHAFSISEREYRETLQDLQTQHDIQQRSIEKIKGVLLSLDQRYGLTHEGHDDLTSVVNYLELQVEKSQRLQVELTASKEEAVKLAAAKGQFLSTMSHEIRTPLNAIIGNIHLLQLEKHTEAQTPFIQALYTSSHNLLSLINDVLDFSKIDEGKIALTLRPIELSSWLQGIRDIHVPKALEQNNKLNIELCTNLPALVLGDEVRLSQILNNLVSNATKFTHQGTVTLSASLTSETSKHASILFSVRDTGIGIDSKFHDAIFERFQQANSSIDRTYGGSGLGLTISQRLVELMGGKIGLSSEPGKGSDFYFSLTFEKVLAAEKEADEIIQSLQGARILMVEDIEFNVKMAERMLTNWHANVDVASNGKMAVDKCRINHYDVVLMDIQMPVMDGITATRFIREFDTETPIIALSACASPEIHQEAMDAGMNSALMKPFNPADLQKSLLRWINSKHKTA